MIAFRNLFTLTKCVRLQPRIVACFSDKWKERDEAAQKVYISRAEKQTMKKLLKKIQLEEQDLESNAEEFDRKLHDVMRRYKITNDDLAREISNLHRTMTQ